MRPDEIQKVMEQPNLKTVLGYRDRTIMEVGYATGIRASGMIGLAVSDVNLEKKILRVRNGKGQRERFAPLSTPACRFLERYISAIRPQLAEGMRPAGNSWLRKTDSGGDTLFLSLYGGAFSRVWLAMVMKNYIRKAGITRPISPVHGFRHSVATHLIENGMDVRYVQAFLGHNSINSTQIYTHVERGTLHRLLKAHHPRELAKEEPIAFKEETHAAA
jgi:integrase/recombinase XerD